ncbi:MAG: aminodeoxychorismate lyase [Steroidobacteraceae bacterium]
MIGRRLVNGVEGGGIAADDRGLHYGDGLFETMAAADGRVLRFALHMARLAEGCRRLAMPMPPFELLEAECARVLEGLGAAVVKLVVPRGPGPRGYAPPAEPSVTRIVNSTAQQVSEAEALRPLVLRVGETRLARYPRLAGIKHLNRLEQVLGAAELREPAVDEGLMRSTDDRLVCATAANIFMVRKGRLLTPQISDCGVSGVMREVVLRAAGGLGIEVEAGNCTLADLERADEVFLTNAVRGIRPVGMVEGIGEFTPGPAIARLREALEADVA